MVEPPTDRGRVRAGVTFGAVALLIGAFVPLERGAFWLELAPRSHEALLGPELALILGIAPAAVGLLCVYLVWRARAGAAARWVLLVIGCALVLGMLSAPYELLGPERRGRWGGWALRYMPWIPGNLPLIAGALTALVCVDRVRTEAPGVGLLRVLGGAAAFSVLWGLLFTRLHGIVSVADIFMLERPMGLGGNDTWLLLVRVLLVAVIGLVLLGGFNSIRRAPSALASKILRVGLAVLAIGIPVVSVILIQGKSHAVGTAIDSFLQIYGGLLILGASLTHVLREVLTPSLEQVFE